MNEWGDLLFLLSGSIFVRFRKNSGIMIRKERLDKKSDLFVLFDTRSFSLLFMHVDFGASRRRFHDNKE